MPTALYRVILRLIGWTRAKRYNIIVYCGPLSSHRLIYKNEKKYLGWGRTYHCTLTHTHTGIFSD